MVVYIVCSARVLSFLSPSVAVACGVSAESVCDVSLSTDLLNLNFGALTV